MKGTVPGTDLQPRAHVTVKDADESLLPPRTAAGEELDGISGIVVFPRAHARTTPQRALDRDWANGDTVELQVPFDFHVRRAMDYPDLASIFYGPVLLAVEEPSSLETWRAIPCDVRDLNASITGDPSTLRFQTHGLGIKPFFEFGRERHSVYVRLEPH